MTEPTRVDHAAPKIVSRAAFQAEVDVLRIREKAHTREGDAIAAARRRLPMVKVDGTTPLVGEGGAVTLLDAFESRWLLIAYYFMWYAGRPASAQCEGCTFFTAQVRELTTLHAKDVSYATFCQDPVESPRGTATSWAGRYRGTPYRRHRSTPFWLDVQRRERNRSGREHARTHRQTHPAAAPRHVQSLGRPHPDHPHSSARWPGLWWAASVVTASLRAVRRLKPAAIDHSLRSAGVNRPAMGSFQARPG
jgi:hypothetical protein